MKNEIDNVTRLRNAADTLIKFFDEAIVNVPIPFLDSETQRRIVGSDTCKSGIKSRIVNSACI